MIDYSAGLFAQLNQTALTDLLAEIDMGVPALISARAIPRDIEVHPIVNFYRTSPIDGGSEIDQQNWTVNCRAETESQAEEIALAAYEILVRHSTSAGTDQFFFIPSILAPLPPADITDLWNVPLDVIVKARKP